jgi:hypothetical protein
MQGGIITMAVQFEYVHFLLCCFYCVLHADLREIKFILSKCVIIGGAGE